MKVLALITARGGSKRIPRKNVRPLGGKPLIEWSITAAKGIPDICDILVSTDDEDIAQIASNAGVMVPWLRPAELATDTASSIDVCLHALNWYEEELGYVDGLLLLQPTSPFRRKSSIINGIELYKQHALDTVIGLSPANTHPLLCFRKEGDSIRPFFNDESGFQLRSQDLPPAYTVNGIFYLITPDKLREQESFYGDGFVPLIIDSLEEGLDIDTEWDWMIAEAILRTNRDLLPVN